MKHSSHRKGIFALSYALLCMVSCQNHHKTSAHTSPWKSNDSTRISQTIQVPSSPGQPVHYRVVFDLKEQRCYLFNGGRVATQSMICSGHAESPTPVGVFRIAAKVHSGRVSSHYKIPMPYWIGLENSKVAIYAGRVPGYPETEGDIRLPIEMARLVFHATSVGTPVEIR